jgi:hypothetical protein
LFNPLAAAGSAVAAATAATTIIDAILFRMFVSSLFANARMGTFPGPFIELAAKHT